MTMSKGDYPSSIDGFRFLQEGESPQVATCWNFQTTESFQPGSAVRLLADLPEDCELSFFDPSAKQEESWLFVRRAGQRYFVKKVGRVASPWVGRPLAAVLASFLASPLVQKPVGYFDSFSISSIPDQQRYEHVGWKALA